MKTRILTAMLGALVLLGPAVGMAQEKPWQALQAVAATPMDSSEMSVVTGKDIFSFLTTSGQSTTLNGATLYFWASTSGTTASVSFSAVGSPGTSGSTILVYR